MKALTDTIIENLEKRSDEAFDDRDKCTLNNAIEMTKRVEKDAKFEEIAISRIVYLNGCVQYSVQAKSKKGDVPVEIWIDEQQLTVLGKGILTEPKPVGGGFRSHPM